MTDDTDDSVAESQRITAEKFKFNFLNDSSYDWMDKAYCRNQQVNTKVFFPPRGRAQSNPSVIKENCDKCEVKFECLEFALNNSIRHGIWGGTSERQRRRLRRTRSNRSNGRFQTEQT